MQISESQLIQHTRETSQQLIALLPEGELNPKWIPKQLMRLEEFTRESFQHNINQDLSALSRSTNQQISEMIWTRLSDKLIFLKTIVQHHKALLENAQHSNEVFRAEQQGIFWVANKADKNVKLKLAKLKQAQKKLAIQIEQEKNDSGDSQRLLTLMRQQGQLQQSLEMLSQKVHDRVDPLRRPETYCVRSNPLAYTTFIPNEKPVIKDPDIGTKAIKQLLQSLKDTT